MKTDNHDTHGRSRTSHFRRRLWQFAFVVGATLPAALPAETPGSGDDKTYAIFVGTDLAVRDGPSRNPVIGADGHNLVVRQGEATRRVPLQGINGLTYERGVKLSSLGAEVDDVKVSFTSQAASREWFQAMSVQMSLRDHAGMMRDKAMGEATRASNVTIPTGNDAQSVRSRNFALAEMARAEADMLVGLDDAAVVDSIADKHAEKTIDDSRRSGADTVKFTFKLSSPHAVGPGYVAVIAQYRMGGPQGVIEHGISVKEFERLDDQPQKFSMEQNALPEAWTLLNYRVAVYADGQEIATNLSDRRTMVNQDEAHRFFVLQYLMAHQGQTRGPAPIVMLPRPQLRAAAHKVELPEEVFVKVDKSGALLSLSADRFGNARVSPACEVFLDNIRFLPALEKGAPVEGSLRLAMADILR